MCNRVIKEKAREAGVRLWQIAEELGITDGTFSRKLRRELPEAEKERIFSIIEALKEVQHGKTA